MDYVKPDGVRLAIHVLVILLSRFIRSGRCKFCGECNVALQNELSMSLWSARALRDACGAGSWRKQGCKVAVLSKVFRPVRIQSRRRVGLPLRWAMLPRTTGTGTCYDTVKGSDYLGDQDAIEFMCRAAPEVVYELEHFGMPFDRLDSGKIYQRPFGGHMQDYGKTPVQRACAAADRTGHALLHTLYQQKCESQHAFLHRVDGAGPGTGCRRRCARRDCAGNRNGRGDDISGARHVVRNRRRGKDFQSSTNAYINTGDGLGMAARAGIPLEDMEFFQFHPTGVYGAGVLISEGVRGEGGYLVNKNGRALHAEIRSDCKRPRQPRMWCPARLPSKINEGRGCGPHGDHILLKLDHLGDDVIRAAAARHP